MSRRSVLKKGEDYKVIKSKFVNSFNSVTGYEHTWMMLVKSKATGEMFQGVFTTDSQHDRPKDPVNKNITLDPKQYKEFGTKFEVK